MKLGVLARNLFIDWFGGSTRTNRGLLIEVVKVRRKFSVELIPVVDEVYWTIKKGKVCRDVVNKWANFYKEHGLLVNERLLKQYIGGNLHRDITSIYKRELMEYDILYDPILIPTADPGLTQIQQIVNPVHVDLIYLKQTGGKLMVLLIGTPDIPLRYNWLLKFTVNYGFLSPKEVMGLTLFIARSKSLISALAKFRDRVLLLSPSPGALKNINATNEFRSVSFYPFYAVDERVLTISTGKKEDYLVFFSRGDVTKGIFEIPKILKLMRRYGCAYKLKIVSGFASERIKRIFLRLVDLYGVKDLIELSGVTGYVSDNNKIDMFNAVSKALLTLNPSHADVIPNVVIESLFLRTPVLMYDILGPYEAFKGAKAIFFTPEFDTKKIALAACNLLENYNINVLFNDEKTKEIIELHKDWRLISNRFISLVIDFYENKALIS
uniref:Glycosyltransferase family 1 protein n=1 Tax=Ignisphaera aggregans TaxID=334771 RepID=A0A7J3YUZ3_9CREN